MRIRSVILLLFLTLSQIFGQKLKPAELVKSQTQFIQKSLFEQNNSERSKTGNESKIFFI